MTLQLLFVVLLAVCRSRLSSSDVSATANNNRPDQSLILTGHVRPAPQVHIPGGRTRLGSSDPSRSETGEHPVRIVDVSPLKVDRYAVTNGDFMVFARQKSRYRTDAELRGYSWVLAGHVSKMTDVHDHRSVGHVDGMAWRAVRNATWLQPYGPPATGLDDRLRPPVVHVSYRDAFAFCAWAGKRLPTEDEWENAAKAGNNESVYPWGQNFTENRGNMWQGQMPAMNSSIDASIRVSPVDKFQPQNKLGLYDMLGNVWEWSSTVFSVPGRTRDLNRPRYTVKGGSFIDSDITVSTRTGLAPDYSAENVGFRCVETDEDAGRRMPVEHRLADTWDFKVRRAVNTIFGTVSKGLRPTDEL